MDKYAQNVFNFICSQIDHSFWYRNIDSLPADFGSEDDFYAACRFLVQNHFAEVIENQTGDHIGIRASHYGIHHDAYMDEKTQAIQALAESAQKIAETAQEEARQSSLEAARSHRIAVLAVIVSVLSVAATLIVGILQALY